MLKSKMQMHLTVPLGGVGTNPESTINQRKPKLFQITVMSVTWIYTINECYGINCPNRTIQI